MAWACNGDGQLQWPARVREVIENIEPVNAPSCYRISLLSSSLEVTARLKSVDDLDLLMNVLESNRAFFVKNDRLAAEVLTLI
jgi:hypothetical protein